MPQAYPPQYYLNNYNINEGVRNGSTPDFKPNTAPNTGGVSQGVNEGVNQGVNREATSGINDGVGRNSEPDFMPNKTIVPNSQSNISGIAPDNQTNDISSAQVKVEDFVPNSQAGVEVSSDKTGENTNVRLNPHSINPPKKEDMSTSNQIIDELDTLDAEQKELEKNGKQTKVVALTNEYIMSLENYLNNPNTEIRLMASKEILTRLDEDKDRYDDAALNALLNKMLQDPQKLIRIAALSAFSSGLASGNDYTVKLLNDIQQNPNSDKDDVVDAANILLNMSASTETKYVPQKPPVQPNN
jgi:hypothetical protein